MFIPTNFTKAMASDLALVLSTLSPKELSDLKSMRMILKICDKCEEQVADIKAEQDALDDATKNLREKFKTADEDEKKVLEKEATALAAPVVERINELRKQEVELELSNEQYELLKNSFKKLVLDKLKTVKYGILFADAFDIQSEEE